MLRCSEPRASITAASDEICFSAATDALFDQLCADKPQFLTQLDILVCIVMMRPPLAVHHQQILMSLLVKHLEAEGAANSAC
eukprot:2994263-Karenia_brevis.AAC.1